MISHPQARPASSRAASKGLGGLASRSLETLRYGGKNPGGEDCLDPSSQVLPHTKSPVSVKHPVGIADTLTCLKVR